MPGELPYVAKRKMIDAARRDDRLFNLIRFLPGATRAALAMLCGERKSTTAKRLHFLQIIGLIQSDRTDYTTHYYPEGRI